MASATVKLSPSFLQSIVSQVIGTSNVRLGVITNGNQVSENLIETTPNDIIAAEFNGSGWTRPSLTLANNGSYNATTDRWSIPSSAIWSITGPSGGLEIKQCFIIIGGTTTPRNTTGLLSGVCTYTNPIVIAAAETKDLQFNSDFFGASS